MLHNILAEHVHLVQILVQAEERFWSTLYISRPAAMADRAEVASKISDLADLLGERKERIAHAVKIIFENKMCLHCSRVYLLEWLSEKDVQQYDQAYRPQHWCKCED